MGSRTSRTGWAGGAGARPPIEASASGLVIDWVKQSRGILSIPGAVFRLSLEATRSNSGKVMGSQSLVRGSSGGRGREKCSKSVGRMGGGGREGGGSAAKRWV
jgi:hypothetical protein